MDPQLPVSGQTSDRFAQMVLAQFDGPAYLRRARRLELTLAALEQQCQAARKEMLAMVCLRLARLHALAGTWERLTPEWLSHAQVEALRRLHAELAPALQATVNPASTRRLLRGAIAELRESVDRFNERWSAYLRSVDLGPVNSLIKDYNRWYVLEKECAVGSHLVARQGFAPHQPMTLERLQERYPLIPPLTRS